jgi:hypothetical protein
VIDGRHAAWEATVAWVSGLLGREGSRAGA